MYARASKVGKAALVVTVLSAIALVVMGVAGFMGIEGAREGEEGPVIFEVLWVTFLLGGVLALVTGILGAVMGARANNDATRNAGVIAMVYVVIAVLVVMFLP